MYINNILFAAGVVCQVVSASVPLLLIGRALVGIGAGATTVVIPVYLGEISPPAYRGMLGACNQLSIVISLLVAEVRTSCDTWKHDMLFSMLLLLLIALSCLVFRGAAKTGDCCWGSPSLIPWCRCRTAHSRSCSQQPCPFQLTKGLRVIARDHCHPHIWL